MNVGVVVIIFLLVLSFLGVPLSYCLGNRYSGSAHMAIWRDLVAQNSLLA